MRHRAAICSSPSTAPRARSSCTFTTTWGATSSIEFLRRLKDASPIKIAKILTDNGSQFTDRLTTKDKKPSGRHVFD
jgi:hypothetical protein